jgi:hypothetical protein
MNQFKIQSTATKSDQFVSKTETICNIDYLNSKLSDKFYEDAALITNKKLIPSIAFQPVSVFHE